MSPEAQRIAIAEACGFINVRMWSESCIASMGVNAKGEYWGSLGVPDYLNDLNAMREAEKMLTEHQWDEYESVLRLVCDGCSYYEGAGKELLHAAAAQRAEAFLKTIDKWEGGSDEIRS